MEMHREYGLSLEPEMERCTLCNSLIRKVGFFEMDILKTKDYVYPERLEKGKSSGFAIMRPGLLAGTTGKTYWKG